MHSYVLQTGLEICNQLYASYSIASLLEPIFDHNRTILADFPSFHLAGLLPITAEINKKELLLGVLWAFVMDNAGSRLRVFFFRDCHCLEWRKCCED